MAHRGRAGARRLENGFLQRAVKVAIDDRRSGETDDNGDVVLAYADLVATGVGFFGPYGAVGSAAYSHAKAPAELIDKHTSWNHQSVVSGRKAKEYLTEAGLNEEAADVAGAVVAGLQSINPTRVYDKPITAVIDWFSD